LTLVASLQDTTILVIEDNPLNMKLIRALLSLSSCTLLEEKNAESGIKTAVQSKPDLILMDLHLPAMDGLAATAILKKNPVTRDIPIIAVTSRAMDGDGTLALDTGCDAYITKPINTRTFVQSITEFLPGKAP
jgi:CheY-like chemotaxis protein